MEQSGIEVRKYWDAAGGRMVIIVRNNGQSVCQATVEDAYPADISGLLCFAKSGGIVPAATASAGKITWRVAGLKPGEVRELVYTSLPRETLRDPSSKKRPTDRDAALLSTMGGLPPRLIFEDTAIDPIAKIPPPEIPAPSPEQPPAGEEPARELPAAEKAAVVISVGAGKGGTGKTTFSINLGIALAEMGFDTVLLDADTSMSNMASYMGIDVQCMKATLHEVLSGKAEPDKAVYRAFNNRLRIVPSGLSIAGFLGMDRNLLGDVISHFSRDADFIVIDTPAGYNKEVALSLYASDYLLLVLNPDEGSMIDGLKVQEMARILDVRVPGIVLNRYDMTGHQYSRSQIEQYFGTPVIAMLPEDGDMRRKDKVPAILASPCSKTSKEIYHVAETISGRKRDTQPVAKPFATRLMEALFKQ
ncbi:AAA family ATPase [Methanocella arvoryzae]|uniref:ATPase involved in chromosome partitioning n=1 Tax=Methanocella arvoryzae (strain DSM 22066 / NBRC 105507 / MRE50) TaxID=351160 RepID=Q0W4Y9_METAR|nr:AAA family ATPase [Methanocella arvoryzae]CAJ36554.1 putative ATPase involved in chromosome partitioning [Methanocella arvoryzae MRE50]